MDSELDNFPIEHDHFRVNLRLKTAILECADRGIVELAIAADCSTRASTTFAFIVGGEAQLNGTADIFTQQLFIVRRCRARIGRKGLTISAACVHRGCQAQACESECKRANVFIRPQR